MDLQIGVSPRWMGRYAEDEPEPGPSMPPGGGRPPFAPPPVQIRGAVHPMTTDDHGQPDSGSVSGGVRYLVAATGTAIAAVCAGLGLTVAANPQSSAAVTTAAIAAITGVVGMLVAGYA